MSRKTSPGNAKLLTTTVLLLALTPEAARAQQPVKNPMQALIDCASANEIPSRQKGFEHEAFSGEQPGFSGSSSYVCFAEKEEGGNPAWATYKQWIFTPDGAATTRLTSSRSSRYVTELPFPDSQGNPRIVAYSWAIPTCAPRAVALQLRPPEHRRPVAGLHPQRRLARQGNGRRLCPRRRLRVEPLLPPSPDVRAKGPDLALRGARGRCKRELTPLRASRASR
jgi:hypothetical protein